VSKSKLDVAVTGVEAMIQVRNDASEFAELAAWLKSQEVTRVGLESGSYVRKVTSYLQEAGFEVVCHQPQEVMLYGRLRRRKAKNDKIDARLIADATAQLDRLAALNDPLLVELAERMTAYEQVSDHLAMWRTQLEQPTLADLRDTYIEIIEQAEVWKQKLLKQLLGKLKSRADLVELFELFQSLPGVGEVVAASFVVRMPELGRLSPAEAASLIGVAPFDFDSGKMKGARRIWGGRARPRQMLYIAAISAKRCDPRLKDFADRLTAKGKTKKVVIVAVMRKLIEAANLIAARRTPWIPSAQLNQ
jgi:transposase